MSKESEGSLHMTEPSDRLKEIEELNEDHWFCDNPNGTDVKEEIDWLIARVKRLTEALENIKFDKGTKAGSTNSANYSLDEKPNVVADVECFRLHEKLARTQRALDIAISALEELIEMNNCDCNWDEEDCPHDGVVSNIADEALFKIRGPK